MLRVDNNKELKGLMPEEVCGLTATNGGILTIPVCNTYFITLYDELYVTYYPLGFDAAYFSKIECNCCSIDNTEYCLEN